MLQQTSYKLSESRQQNLHAHVCRYVNYFEGNLKHKCYVKMAFSTASSTDLYCQTLHGCQCNFFLVCLYWHRFKRRCFSLQQRIIPALTKIIHYTTFIWKLRDVFEQEMLLFQNNHFINKKCRGHTKFTVHKKMNLLLPNKLNSVFRCGLKLF